MEPKKKKKWVGKEGRERKEKKKEKKISSFIEIILGLRSELDVYLKSSLKKSIIFSIQYSNSQRFTQALVPRP